jgi:hypothetical protein
MALPLTPPARGQGAHSRAILARLRVGLAATLRDGIRRDRATARHGDHPGAGVSIAPMLIGPGSWQSALAVSDVWRAAADAYSGGRLSTRNGIAPDWECGNAHEALCAELPSWPGKGARPPRHAAD